MMIIQFAFAFVSLIIMCCAFHSRMTRDQANLTDDVLTSEQEFHALIAQIDAQITLGLFGFARETCAKAFQTLTAARLNRKTTYTQVLTDLQQLDKYIHELEYEAEALPLYRELKASLKIALGDKHDLTWHAKKQSKQLHNFTNAGTEPTWFDALIGRNIRELVPMLVGELVYDQCRQIASWTKEMCRVPEPCYATRVIRR